MLNFIPELADLGIGVHYAGLALEDRKRVEDMFLKGLLRIVFATSVELKGLNLDMADSHKTLAVGVNLRKLSYALTAVP